MKRLLLLAGLCTCLAYPQARAGLFGEHKRIGDLSFIQFVNELNLHAFFRDTLRFSQYGVDQPIPFQRNPEVKSYYQGMFAIDDTKNYYSYGDLCALSGDHSIDPAQLLEALYSGQAFGATIFDSQPQPDPTSETFSRLIAKLRCVNLLQREAIDQGKKETSYIYLSYILLANADQSHFQRPPLSVPEMLKSIDFPLIALLDTLARYPFKHGNDKEDTLLIRIRKEIDSRFLHLNNTSKYAIMHLLALDRMNGAATDYCNSQQTQFVLNFRMALIFNAFADHFLQDAFAAGHIPVQRSIFGLDNKGVHDYYCRNGLNVCNRRGECWRTYGDGFYDSATYYHAIQANLASLTELWAYFNEVKDHIRSIGDFPLSLFEDLAAKKTDVSSLPNTLPDLFTCYAYEPIPYNVKTYRDSIALKRGSKPGAYIDAGIFTLPGATHLHAGFNGELSLLSFNLTNYDSDYNKVSVHPHPGRETKYWIGGGLAFDYSLIRIDSSLVYTMGGAIDFTLWDRLLASLNVGVIHQHSSYFLLRPMIGYELKRLRSPFAPSVRVFYDISKLQLTKFGILVSLRLY